MTQQPNAFENNTVGLAGRPFPFSVQSEHDPAADIWRVDTWAVRLRDVVDLVVAAAGPYLVVYDVGHYESDDGKNFLDLAAIAERRGVSHRALDMDWASYRPSGVRERQELIVIATMALMALIGDLGLYELSLLSVADQPDEEQLEQMILNAKLGEPHSLSSVPEADLALNIHDDCYLHVEARRRDQVLQFGGRVLATFAETVARRNGLETSVADPSVDIQNALFDAAPAWTAGQTKASVTDGEIVVRLAKTTWRLGEPEPDDQDATATYRTATQTWRWSATG